MISGNVNDGLPFLKGNNEIDLIDFTFIQDSSIGSLTFAAPLYSGTGTQSCKPLMFWLVFMTLMERCL